MIDRQPLDVWTVIHFSAGLILGNSGMSQRDAYAVIGLWEAFEPMFWPDWAEVKNNIAVDIVVGIAGYEIGAQLRSVAEEKR